MTLSPQPAPSGGLTPAAIAAAFLAACRAELDTLKPGNVHRFAAGHGMESSTFEASARASVPAIAAPGCKVGARILRATEASWDAVGLNANLGIVLLCAPLAAAAGQLSGPREPSSFAAGLGRLRLATIAVLGGLDMSDARDAFAAIALAAPGGLGIDEAADVRSSPAIGLVDAMRLAESRDRIARQYASGFRDIFEIGVPALRGAAEKSHTAARRPENPLTASLGTGLGTGTGLGPVLDCFLAFAGGFPDSHIARKFGEDVAETVRVRMADLAGRLAAESDPQARFALALGLDGELKREGRNPGTSADLTVASLFACFLAEAAAR